MKIKTGLILSLAVLGIFLGLDSKIAHADYPCGAYSFKPAFFSGAHASIDSNGFCGTAVLGDTLATGGHPDAQWGGIYAIPSCINSVPRFVDYITALYEGSSAKGCDGQPISNGSEFQKVAAGFIVDDMENALYGSSKTLMPTESEVLYWGGFLKYYYQNTPNLVDFNATLPSTQFNTLQINHASCNYSTQKSYTGTPTVKDYCDVAQYNDTEPQNHVIVFKNSSGNIWYEVKHLCANPVNSANRPPVLIGHSTVNPGTSGGTSTGTVKLQQGDTATFAHWIHNGGAGSAFNFGWEVQGQWVSSGQQVSSNNSAWSNSTCGAQGQSGAGAVNDPSNGKCPPSLDQNPSASYSFLNTTDKGCPLANSSIGNTPCHYERYTFPSSASPGDQYCERIHYTYSGDPFSSNGTADGYTTDPSQGYVCVQLAAPTGWKLDGHSTVAAGTTAGTGTTTVSRQAGQQATFAHWIHNNGPAAAQFGWQIQSRYIPNGGTPTSWSNSGLASNSSASLSPNDKTGCGLAGSSIGVTPCHEDSYTFPSSAKDGDQHCERIWYTYANGPNNPDAGASNQDAVIANANNDTGVCAVYGAPVIVEGVVYTEDNGVRRNGPGGIKVSDNNGQTVSTYSNGSFLLSETQGRPFSVSVVGGQPSGYTQTSVRPFTSPSWPQPNSYLKCAAFTSATTVPDYCSQYSSYINQVAGVYQKNGGYDRASDYGYDFVLTKAPTTLACLGLTTSPAYVQPNNAWTLSVGVQYSRPANYDHATTFSSQFGSLTLHSGYYYNYKFTASIPSAGWQQDGAVNGMSWSGNNATSSPFNGPLMANIGQYAAQWYLSQQKVNYQDVPQPVYTLTTIKGLGGVSVTYPKLTGYTPFREKSYGSWSQVAPTPPTPCSQAFNVYDLPYFKVYGSGIQAGGEFSDRTAASGYPNGLLAGWYNNSGANSGSSAELSDLALIAITGVASAQSPTTSYGQTYLTFANNSSTSTDGNTFSPKLGGNFGLSSPVTLWQPNVNAPGGCVSSVDQPSGVYNCSSDVTLGTSGVSNQVVLQVKGNVYINGDITFNGAGSWNSASQIPSLIIEADGGNIYIAPGVTHLDGIYVAKKKASGVPSRSNGGIIYTCANASGPVMADGNYYSICNNQLDVHGSFVADQVNLMRTFGTLNNDNATSSGQPAGGGGGGRHQQRSVGGGGGSPSAPGTCYGSGIQVVSWSCAAEVFEFSPEMYLANPPLKSSCGNYCYQSIISLPPVL